MHEHPPTAPPAAPSPQGEPSEPAPELLVRFLADRDHPCPACNYNLRALTGTRCPECNQRLELCVGLVEPRLGASFMAGLIGVCMGLGIQVVILVFACYQFVRRGGFAGGGPRLGEIVPLIVGVLAATAALVVWMRARRRHFCLPVFTRWIYAALAVGLGFLGFVWFTQVIR